jgi:hypothetical protein
MTLNDSTGELKRLWHLFCRYKWVPVLSLLAFGFLFYRSCLRGYFLADDFGYVQLFSATKLANFPYLFFDDWSHGIWGFKLQELRPLMGLTYWLDFLIWGVDAFGYHLSNLIFYLLGIAALYLLVEETTKNLWEVDSVREPGAVFTGGAVSAFVAAFLFLLHPSHVEAVAWISGRTDLLAAVASLWGLYCLVRFWNGSGTSFLIVGNIIFLVGLFMKENVITLPAAFLLYMLLASQPGRRWKQWVSALAPSAVLALLWIVLRRSVFGSAFPFADVKGVESFVYRFPFYASQILWLPSTGAAIGLGLFFLACLIYGLAKWNRLGRMVVFWGVCWPVLQLFPMVSASYESSRHVFLAAVGPLVVGSLAVPMLWRKQRAVGGCAMAVCLALAILFAAHTRTHLVLWEQSGDYSRRLLVSLRDGHYSADDIVVLASRPPVQGVWFWEWVLPFATQPPFMNFQGRIVEALEWFCCPGPDWLAKRRSVLEEIVKGKIVHLHRIDFNGATGQFENHVVKNPFIGNKDLESFTQEQAVKWIQEVQAAPVLK